MAADNAKSQEVLCEEILAGARRQAEEILRRGRADAEALLAKAKTDAEKEHQDKLAAAKADAERVRELAVARMPIDVSRMRSARVEEILKSIYEESRRRLLARDGFDYREAMAALAAEAIGRMAGDRFVIQVSADDRASLGDGWLQDVRRRAARPNLDVSFAADPARIAGGLMVRDADGRQVWDDSLEARLARLWPAARREIAVQMGLIEGGAAPLEAKGTVPFSEHPEKGTAPRREGSQ